MKNKKMMNKQNKNNNGFITYEALINDLNLIIEQQRIKIMRKQSLINQALKKDINFFNSLGIKHINQIEAQKW